MSSEPVAPAQAPLAAVGEPGETPPARRCQNCGEPLLGEHCYACGQPTKGLVRHFGSILGDFFDSVFELDSRILRTLGPLLFRPGYLSTEYFAGRRVRYVSPVRLFVFLSLFAFFAAQLGFDIDNGEDGATVDVVDRDRLERATTVADVERIRDEAIAELATARTEAADVPGVAPGLAAAERQIATAAERRIAELERAKAEGRPPRTADDAPPSITIGGGKPWHPETNPLRIGWLPDAVNAKLNQQIGRAQGNIEEIRDDPNKLKDAFLSTVPTTLFVLLPLFAVLLKVVYAFKRRLYMEHLIVALHSHSFLCAGLLLAIVFDALKTWTGGALSWGFNVLEIAVLAWLPLYLLLMQKRIYGQGWIMTLLKYAVLGTCYVVLIAFGAAASLMISLVSM
jgi:hypothetical protein